MSATKGTRWMLLIAVALPLLALGSLTVIPRNAKDYTNYPGADIGNRAMNNATDCEKMCRGNRSCYAWTWVRPGIQNDTGMCWIKSGAPTVVKDRCCVSGLKQPSGSWEQGIDRPGQDYHGFDLAETNPDRCKSACSADGKCRAWTYVKPNVQGPSARCYLKQSVPNPVANDCCVSGAWPSK